MASTTTSKWADLLKPPAPKAEPVAEKTAAAATAVVGGETQAVAAAAAAEFNAEKFQQYAKATAADHAAVLARPTEEQFAQLQRMLAASKAQGLEALKALPSAEHCFLFPETRYALYLPTQEEIDVAQGWEIRTEKKASDFSGSFVVLSADAKKVLEVLPRDKGEKKVRGSTAVNLVEVEAGKPATKGAKSLVERAKTAIAEWNARASRSEGKKRQILFTESATPLLSSALETCHELQSTGLVAAEDTAILAADLSAVITVFKNHVAFANWSPRTKENGAKRGSAQGDRRFKKDDNKERSGFKPKRDSQRAPKTN